MKVPLEKMTKAGYAQRETRMTKEPRKDLSHLTPYEEEWVALAKDLKVVAHHSKLQELRKQLGGSAQDYSYFFVPSSQYSYIGSWLS